MLQLLLTTLLGATVGLLTGLLVVAILHIVRAIFGGPSARAVID